MKKKLTILSIGPGDPSLLNQVTLDRILSASPLLLRTARHPIVPWLEEKQVPYLSLDDLYEESGDFETLYGLIAEQVLQHVSSGKKTVYAIPDLLSDRSVDQLFAMAEECGVSVEAVPGFSYADHFLSRCRGFFPSGNIRVVTAGEMLSGFYDPDDSVLITEIDRDILAGELKIMLSGLLEDEAPVYFLSGFDYPRKIMLFELDRQKNYDHLTALLIPSADFLHRSRYTMHDLMRIMECLRAPDGCPWDRVQTHRSLQPYIVEEAWESIIAMDEQDPDHLADELGDLLFQIVFHASIGRSLDEFTMDDVLTHICSKMIQRHPHVFGDARFSTAQDVADQWETMKRSETGSRTVAESLDDVAPAFPALKYAIKVMKKAQQAPAFRRDPAELVREIAEACGKLLLPDGSLDEATMGILLLKCMHLCHLCGRDGEIILHRTVDRFKEMMRKADSLIREDGKDLENLTFRELSVYLKRVEG